MLEELATRFAHVTAMALGTVYGLMSSDAVYAVLCKIMLAKLVCRYASSQVRR